MLYITNNKVAWQVPVHLEEYYEKGYYILPNGWSVMKMKPKLYCYWETGRQGELRLIEVERKKVI